MQLHASCVALDGIGVVFLGPSGAGKSDLALRMIDRGFVLVADDRVEILNGMAYPPAALAGLLEVRGLGILRLPHVPGARVALAVELGPDQPRLPAPRRHAALGVPLLALDPRPASTAQRVALALDCVHGRIAQTAGAFTA